MKNYRLLNFVFFFFFLLGFSLLAKAGERQALIIDTDMGRDDVIAIMYLAKDPRVAIKAVTIESNGNVHCAPAFRNTLGLLKLLGLAQVPVACGSEAQVAGGHVFPKPVIDREDTLSGAAAFLPKVDVPVSHDAVALLVKTILAQQGKVNILAIGPLTNIARSFQLDPSIKQKINKIYVMGGAVHVRGNIDNTVANKSDVAEWNIYFDPVGASIVFANLPVVLVPLDATNQAPMDGKFLELVSGGGQGDYLYKVLKVSEKLLRTGLWYFWDPLAAVVASDERYCEFKSERLRVLVEPEKLSGATVVDDKGGALVKICNKVKVGEFERQLVDVIRS
jgi:inosine-uridine nucleoside N-ribohydrolase